jgi:hypothetical protein
MVHLPQPDHRQNDAHLQLCDIRRGTDVRQLAYVLRFGRSRR